ncbi:hypothetical protein [Flavobacterium pectinovorum]|uniref:hypothetical protein n=1 Tax=Flavobacterium pectinovorum TaxID=29533 RepID=UPI001FAC71C4|nr:hypothetical protein [Flavobacterium pectinovorum]MCI9844231.1 hypothetical protein [Flavobacterium pectinovorum]
MKNILLFCLFCTTAIAQNKNFNVEYNIITWKKVFDEPLSISDLKNNPRLEFKTDSTGSIKKGIENSNWLKEYTADFKIEKKTGRYRASVYNIRFYDSEVRVNSGETKTISSSDYPIEKEWLKNDGTIRGSLFWFNITETMNPFLTELFTAKKTVKEDW